MKSSWVLITICLLAVASCTSWQPSAARSVQFASPRLAHDTAVAALHDHGYKLTEVDDKHGYVQAEAKNAGSTSFSFQVRGDGSLEIKADGSGVNRFEETARADVLTELDVIETLLERRRDAAAKK